MIALKTLMFTILAPGPVVCIVPWLLLRWSAEAVMPSLSTWLIGLFPLLAGVVLYFWCAGAFTFIGKGTPAPIDGPVFLFEQALDTWRGPLPVAGNWLVHLGRNSFVINRETRPDFSRTKRE